MTCALYRHFDADGALLYVGITNDPRRRLKQHKRTARWSEQIASVTVKWLADRDEAIAAERKAIAEERPLFNGGEVRGPAPSGDAFRDWIAEEGIYQSEIAEAYGISNATLSNMISGKRRVPLRFAAFIEDISEGAVPMRYWLFGETAEMTKASGGYLCFADLLAEDPEATA